MEGLVFREMLSRLFIYLITSPDIHTLNALRALQGGKKAAATKDRLVYHALEDQQSHPCAMTPILPFVLTFQQ